jgi:hypothetical protein
VLKELSPRLDRITKDLEGIKRHLHEPQPKAAKETAEKEATISSDELAQGHAALKANNPTWKYCPTCTDDNAAKLPDTPATDPRNIEGPGNARVKCDTCGAIALEQWERCPGCGAKGNNFSPAD